MRRYVFYRQHLQENHSRLIQYLNHRVDPRELIGTWNDTTTVTEVFYDLFNSLDPESNSENKERPSSPEPRRN